MIALVIICSLIAYYNVGKRLQSLIMIGISLYMYWNVAEWNVLIISGIVGAILFVNKLMEKKQSKVLIAITIAILIAVFITLRERFIGFVLPLGYSVLSFSAISLLVDQYKNTKKYGLVEIANYLLFFPKIFAGPIERASQFIHNDKKHFTVSGIYTGVKYLIYAAFLKLVVGDIISVTDISGYGVNALCQVFIFAIGFFFDFWAYSLMAIGAGQIFGYNLSISFDRPYYSTSFKDFWHRWNITLGTWLREYIYIPLGGNRNNSLKWSFVILTVFIISGFWHGSTLPFITWGIIHGLLMCFERFVIKPYRFHGIIKVFYSFVVFVLVAFLWQLFDISTITELSTRMSRIFAYEGIDNQLLLQLGLCLLSVTTLTSSKVTTLISVNSTNKKHILIEVGMLTLMLATLFVLNCPMSLNFFYFRF